MRTGPTTNIHAPPNPAEHSHLSCRVSARGRVSARPQRTCRSNHRRPAAHRSRRHRSTVGSTSRSGSAPRCSPASRSTRRSINAPRPTRPKSASGTRRPRSTSAFAPSSRTAPSPRTLADRDRISADDNVEIHLDTFDERNRALVFIVNPLGVQADGTKSEGGGFIPGANVAPGQNDLSADFVWQSKRPRRRSGATRSRSGFRSAACAIAWPTCSAGAFRSIATCSTAATRKRGRRRSARRRRSSGRRDGSPNLTGMHHGAGRRAQSRADEHGERHAVLHARARATGTTRRIRSSAATCAGRSAATSCSTAR